MLKSNKKSKMQLLEIKQIGWRKKDTVGENIMGSLKSRNNLDVIFNIVIAIFNFSLYSTFI